MPRLCYSIFVEGLLVVGLGEVEVYIIVDGRRGNLINPIGTIATDCLSCRTMMIRARVVTVDTRAETLEIKISMSLTNKLKATLLKHLWHIYEGLGKTFCATAMVCQSSKAPSKVKNLFIHYFISKTYITSTNANKNSL